MAPLSWRHHTLLQALLTRGPLSEREFHTLFTAVSGKNPEAIVQEAGNDGSITSIDALNVRLDNQVVIIDGSQDSQSRLPTSIKNFSFSQKEKTLEDLIQDRWLANTSTGKIGLGTRSFLDLRSWFRGNDIPSCVVCNEACIKASSCPNEGCNVRIHEYCLKQKFSQRKQASRACPGCGTEWPCQDDEANGDDDVDGPGEDQAPSANRSSRKKRKQVKAELVEENDNAGPSTAVPRRTSRSTKAEAVEAAKEASAAGASQATRTSKRRKK
ncbi:unnamed protein product [Urochloa decumbens]|uniref:Non-structural maintenance of chromosomes element 1 homolog n=1 Tax=Urochloa decumbens TaxID=240449 RepID=A0ABC9FUL8_9POAL